MDEPLPRAGLALGVALVLGIAVMRVRALSRDVVMVGYAALVIVLGIFAFLGPSAAAIGAAVVMLAVALGGLIYGLLSLVARWANR